MSSVQPLSFVSSSSQNVHALSFMKGGNRWVYDGARVQVYIWCLFRPGACMSWLVMETSMRTCVCRCARLCNSTSMYAPSAERLIGQPRSWWRTRRLEREQEVKAEDEYFCASSRPCSRRTAVTARRSDDTIQSISALCSGTRIYT